MKKYLPVALLLLAGCSTTDSGSKQDVPSPSQAALVQVFGTEQPTSGRTMNLSAISCKDTPIGPPASRDAAMLQLRQRALQNGFIALHSVQVEPLSGDLLNGCVSAVRARGVGFNPDK